MSLIAFVDIWWNETKVGTQKRNFHVLELSKIKAFQSLEWNVTPRIWAFGGELEIVEIYIALFPLLFLFSRDLAKESCTFAFHACRHEVKPTACNKGKYAFNN